MKTTAYIIEKIMFLYVCKLLFGITSSIISEEEHDLYIQTEHISVLITWVLFFFNLYLSSINSIFRHKMFTLKKSLILLGFFVFIYVIAFNFKSASYYTDFETIKCQVKNCNPFLKSIIVLILSY